MSYGIELINDYNYSITSMDDVNYVLRKAGTISNSLFSSGAGNIPSYFTMDLSAYNSPIVFFKSITPNQRLGQVPAITALRGKAITLYKWWNLDIGTVQYYIFDKWIPPERSTYGMQIFDAAGNIIFDSGWNFMKLRKVVWLDTGFPNHAGHLSGSSWTNIGNAGEGNLSIAMPVSRGYIYSAGVFGHMTYECVHLDTDGNMFCSLVDAGEFLDVTAAFGYVGDMRSQVMVADVSTLPTNYG
ncbi:hypothetical protein EDC53_102343 [Phytobacter diazotrophicus]|nr:hypothetical protein EDC53_102343 [Phytobacter diazotrophicus]